MFRATVITLFPDLFPGPLAAGLAGQALTRGDWTVETVDLRAHGLGPHRTVDDTPYGGGAGMVLKPDVAASAIATARVLNPGVPVIHLSPRGAPLQQSRLAELAKGSGMILLCSRYEGVDQRVLDAERIEEISIGDYVLLGGELPALVLLEGTVRLLAGTVGNDQTHVEESFSPGLGEALLEYPHYTRPPEWQGLPVPAVLQSGNHAAIAAWRRGEAEAVTQARRPDLWVRHSAKDEE